MKNIFSPIFLVSLLLLSISHYLDIRNYQIIQPFILLIFLPALVLYKFKKYIPAYVLITLSFALLLTTQFIKEKETFYRVKQLSIPQDQYISLEGRLKAFPEIKQDHSVIFLETKSLEFNRKKISPTFNIRIKVEGNLENLYRGDTIAINAKVYPTTLNKNFFPNPIENYLLVRKNHFNGYCKSARMVSIVKRTSFFWQIVGGWRNKIREAIVENTTSTRGVFLQAVLIGERGELSENQEEQLLNAGVFHLLAISGAHIGIIAIFCLWVMEHLKVSFKKRYIITGVVLIIFLVLSGFRVSAERAVFMGILIFTARILTRDFNPFNIISFCGLLLLARNPAEFLDAGFILTFSLTAVIVIGRRIFLPWLERWEILKKKPFNIAELISANFSASLMALPLSLFFFKRYSFSGFISGLLLVPLTAVITALGLILIPLAPISSFLARHLLIILDIPLRVFFYIAAFFSDAIDLSIFRASPSIFWVLLILIAFYFFSISKTKRQKVFLASVTLLLMLFISVNLFFYAPENLEVFFLDVGQGDAQVVVFPGGDALLIDGGGAYFSDFKVGQKIVLPFILQKRINIKWIAVSHYHPDHAYGIAEIIHIIKPEELWISSETPGEPGYQKLFRVIPASTRVEKVNASSTPVYKEIGGCTVEFLYPDRFIKENRSHNNHSQVIKISDRYHSFLFTADIEKEVEADLRKNNCSALQSTVIKVPHHGSASSSGPGFLKCVNPRLAVFSYALSNRFGFPHKEALKTYHAQGIPYLSTARSGGICLASLPNGIKIETSK